MQKLEVHNKYTPNHVSSTDTKQKEVIEIINAQKGYLKTVWQLI